MLLSERALTYLDRPEPREDFCRNSPEQRDYERLLLLR